MADKIGKNSCIVLDLRATSAQKSRGLRVEKERVESEFVKSGEDETEKTLARAKLWIEQFSENA